MYSHVGRIRAVELYIKLSKRVKAIIRPLGYPLKRRVPGRGIGGASGTMR